MPSWEFHLGIILLGMVEAQSVCAGVCVHAHTCKWILFLSSNCMEGITTKEVVNEAVGNWLELFFLPCMIIITINQDKTRLCANSVASTVPTMAMDAVFIKTERQSSINQWEKDRSQKRGKAHCLLVSFYLSLDLLTAQRCVPWLRRPWLLCFGWCSSIKNKMCLKFIPAVLIFLFVPSSFSIRNKNSSHALQNFHYKNWEEK